MDILNCPSAEYLCVFIVVHFLVYSTYDNSGQRYAAGRIGQFAVHGVVNVNITLTF